MLMPLLCVVCNIFLLYCRLHFYLTDCFFCCAETFMVDLVPLIFLQLINNYQYSYKTHNEDIYVTI